MRTNIDEVEFVKKADAILMKDYTDIDLRIEKLLKDMYKGNKNIAWAFQLIELKPELYKERLKVFDKRF